MDGYDELDEKIINQTERAMGGMADDRDYAECNDPSGELMEIVLNTREQCQMMEQLIHNQIEVKDDMINRLHKELEYYKQGAADRFTDQLMKAVIQVRKKMNRLMSSDNWAEMSAADMQREYTYVFEDLTDLLEQQNVDAYQTEPGADFNASIHQPKLETTDDPSLDKKVKASLGEGYRKGDKVLQPERVVVYQYKA